MKVKFGRLNLKITSPEGEVRKLKVVDISEVVPILSISNFDIEIKGFGILLRTEDNSKYVFKLASYHHLEEDEVLREYEILKILEKFNNYAIINGRYVKILGITRGWRVSLRDIVYGAGSPFKGAGIVYEESLLDHRDDEGVRVPMYVIDGKQGYPIGYPRKIERYPRDELVYELIVEGDKLEETDYFYVPSFAISPPSSYY